MRYLILFFSLVLADVGTKFLAVVYAPQGEFLRLVYNNNAAMGIEIGFPYWKEVSLVLLPVIWFLAKQIKNTNLRYISLSFMLSGALVNSVERLVSNQGVVDFWNLSGLVGLPSYYCNFADIYQWVGYGILMVAVYKQDEKAPKTQKI